MTQVKQDITQKSDYQPAALALEKMIADEVHAKVDQVKVAIDLLDGGATVPFIARYRKEATGGLDDEQLRLLESRLSYLREFEERRNSILQIIFEQGKLTPELEAKFLAATTKTEIEDYYLPYKQKRRTKAMIAREAGLGPLAEALLLNAQLEPEMAALDYINDEAGFSSVQQVLEGTRFILMDLFSEDADLLVTLRHLMWNQGKLIASVDEDKKQEGQKYKDYFAFEESIKSVPSHRALALFRGRNEGILQLSLRLPETIEALPLTEMTQFFEKKYHNNITHQWMLDSIRLAWRAKLSVSITLDLMNQLREMAEEEAIRVFAKNLKALLLAAPAGNKTILGLDPGIRTGCKVACVDETGKVLDHTTIYPHQPKKDWEGALATLEGLCKKHEIYLIAIGNGTASRETDQLVVDLIKRIPSLKKMMVSEAGASVYSASELASKELPDLDVSIRGAVSIARRLQDPLAELVKIDPKSIGVGQYQHDVNQSLLVKSLNNVIEDCVNAVGVDLNTASSALLAHVSGLNKTLAQNIVLFRDEHGAFVNRDALKKVPRMGAKTFEQAAGFLRVYGPQPLDRSAVHPEAYPVVERILQKSNKSLEQIIGNQTFLRKLNPRDYICERFGLPTVTDILQELEKPGRDPRPEFITANFKENIEKIEDLHEGMLLEGVVSNVANFGAFVDIGVHQDGLVHISCLSDQFVKDPHQVVSVGQVVKVKVLEVDITRKRIQLSMRLEGSINLESNKTKASNSQRSDKKKQNSKHSAWQIGNNPFADALKGLKKE